METSTGVHTTTLTSADIARLNQLLADSSGTTLRTCDARAWFGGYRHSGDPALTVAARVGWSHGEILSCIAEATRVDSIDEIGYTSFVIELPPDKVHPALGVGWDTTRLFVFPTLCQAKVTSNNNN